MSELSRIRSSCAPLAVLACSFAAGAAFAHASSPHQYVSTPIATGLLNTSGFLGPPNLAFDPSGNTMYLGDFGAFFTIELLHHARARRRNLADLELQRHQRGPGRGLEGSESDEIFRCEIEASGFRFCGAGPARSRDDGEGLRAVGGPGSQAFPGFAAVVESFDQRFISLRMAPHASAGGDRHAADQSNTHSRWLRAKRLLYGLGLSRRSLSTRKSAVSSLSFSRCQLSGSPHFETRSSSSMPPS